MSHAKRLLLLVFVTGTLAFTPNCADDFTTASKTVNATTSAQATLTKVEFGAHPEDSYDRLVFTFTGGIPSATIQYSSQALSCGSGNPVPLQGTAILKARFASSVAHNDNGMVTVNTTQLTGSSEAILEAKQICDFEGVVEWALGTNRVAPFRVTTLSNPSRIVIDVRR